MLGSAHRQYTNKVAPMGDSSKAAAITSNTALTAADDTPHSAGQFKPPKEPAYTEELGAVAERTIAAHQTSSWGFHVIARTQGGQAAKDAIGSAITTVGVVSALMLTFTLPSLITPPNSVMEEGTDAAMFRWWWYFQFLSVLLSFCSLLSSTLLNMYLQHLPDHAVGPYLERMKPSFVLGNVAFSASIVLALQACLAAVFPFLQARDFIVSAALIGCANIIFLGILAHEETYFGSYFVAVSKRVLPHLYAQGSQQHQEQQGQGEQRPEGASVREKAGIGAGAGGGSSLKEKLTGQ